MIVVHLKIKFQKKREFMQKKKIKEKIKSIYKKMHCIWNCLYIRIWRKEGAETNGKKRREEGKLKNCLGSNKIYVKITC